MNLGKYILLFLVLCICTIPVYGYNTNHIYVGIEVTNNGTHVPVTINVNGINLDNKVNNIQSEYNQLTSMLYNTRFGIVDFLYITQLKDNLLRLYNSEIYNIVNSKNFSKNKLITLLSKKQQVSQRYDMMLIKLLESLSNNKQTYTSLGWYDIYGNHKSFSDNIEFTSNMDFRILDCYSSIGKSHVLSGGTIHIVGLIYNYGTVTTENMKVELVNPYNVYSPNTILSCSIGENISNGNYNIVWITPTEFKININTTSMGYGIRQVNIYYNKTYVSCQFIILKPYINIQHFGAFTRIQTNYPHVVVKMGKYTKVLEPYNGVCYIYGNYSTIHGAY